MKPDWRSIRNGREIPTETYSDQPYVIKTDDGAWLVAVTTGSGREGQAGQHIVTMRSTDQAQTWSDRVAVEPPSGPEASYAVLLKVPQGYPNAGRIYIFYNHNTDNVRQVIADTSAYPDGFCRRVDSLGHFVFKFSDDHGRSWSHERYDIPLRTMAIDRENPYRGTLKFFWNVGKPFTHEDAAYVPLHKVGGFGEGFFTRSEGVLLKSTNLMSEHDPTHVTWETLPDGDIGLRTPPGGGPIAEEQSFVVLSDGSFYVVYRSVDGHPVEAYSRDGGHTWSTPHYRRYADGRLMKHPRAANFVWKCENGKYLYWFHNHGGRFIREHPRRPTIAYEDRNPAWLCGGVEVDSPEGKIILWSQPEIVLYDDDPYIRMSYPDLIEDEGRLFITETQKDKARVHEIDRTLVEALWGQFDRPRIAANGLLLALPDQGQPMPTSIIMTELPTFLERDSNRADYGTRDLRGGFTIELWLQLDSMDPNQIVLDNRTASGQGFCLCTTPRGTLQIVLNDGRTESRWECDPGMLRVAKAHHIVVIVDGGPKIISFVIDGKLNDGGDFRQFGWGRYNPNLRGIHGSDTLRIGPHLKGQVLAMRLYARALLVSEAVGNYRVGL